MNQEIQPILLTTRGRQWHTQREKVQVGSHSSSGEERNAEKNKINILGECQVGRKLFMSGMELSLQSKTGDGECPPAQAVKNVSKKSNQTTKQTTNQFINASKRLWCRSTFSWHFICTNWKATLYS